MFTVYSKVLVFNFREMRNTVFFEPKNWWKGDIYSYWEFLFLTLRRREIWSFLSQKVDGKMILLITGKFMFWALINFCFGIF